MGKIIYTSELKADILGWDQRNWFTFLEFSQRFLEESPRGQRAIEVGARRGGLSLFLALQGYAVVCSDLYNPESLARETHRKYGVTGNITYAAVDILNAPYPDHSFDIVMFKSVLGYLKTLEKQRHAVKELHRILKPGGRLLFAENAVGSRLHQYLRSKFITRTPHWRFVTGDEVKEMSSIFSQVIIDRFGFAGLLGWNEKVRNILGVFDSFIVPFTPPGWRYIILGCATK